jgi:21S rRNA (uridine2791-2'-O)-methyltransferase
MDSKYKFFKKGQMVVDLGYAPGSWSQVAQERTKPNGQIVGIDLIPAQPPKGVSTIQGNFLSPAVQNLVKEYLREFSRKRPEFKKSTEDDDQGSGVLNAEEFNALIRGRPSYIDAERADTADHEPYDDGGRLVDVSLVAHRRW